MERIANRRHALFNHFGLPDVGGVGSELGEDLTAANRIGNLASGNTRGTMLRARPLLSQFGI